MSPDPTVAYIILALIFIALFLIARSILSRLRKSESQTQTEARRIGAWQLVERFSVVASIISFAVQVVQWVAS